MFQQYTLLSGISIPEPYIDLESLGVHFWVLASLPRMDKDLSTTSSSSFDFYMFSTITFFLILL